MRLSRISGAVASGGVCTIGPVRCQGFVGGCYCFSSPVLNILKGAHYLYSFTQGEDDADEFGSKGELAFVAKFRANHRKALSRSMSTRAACAFDAVWKVLVRSWDGNAFVLWLTIDIP